MSGTSLPWIRTQAGKVPWRQIGVLSTLLMELAVLVPWLRLVLSSADAPPAWVMLLWAFAVALVGRLVARMIQGYRLRESVATAFSGLILMLTILLSVNLMLAPARLLNLWAAGVQIVRGVLEVFPPGHAALLALAAIWIWRRGIASAMPTYQEPRATGFKFRLGVLVFAAYFIVVGSRAPGAPVLLPAFFVSALLAMSISRAHWLARLRGAGEPPFTWQWLGSLLLLFGLVVGGGLALGWLLNSPLGHQALSGLLFLLFAMVELTYRLMLPILIVLEPWLRRLLMMIRGLLEGLPGILDPMLAGLQGQAGPDASDEPGLFFRTLMTVYDFLVLHWAVIRIMLLVFGVVLLLYLALRFRRLQADSGADRDLPRDAGENLLGARRKRSGLAGVVDAVRAWGSALSRGRLRTAIVVRRTYAQMLDLAETYGRARRQWETPLEFEGSLMGLFPQAVAEVQMITEAYVKVRYGQLEQTADMVKEVQTAWGRLQELYSGRQEWDDGNES